MTENCNHEFETINAEISDQKLLASGVYLECIKCGGIKFEERPVID